MAIQDYCIGLKGVVNAIHKVTRALSGNVNSTTISDAVEEVAIAIENGGGGGGGGTTDHTKLQNRDSADQHPISAITGLETELNEKANASSTYTKSEVDSSLATKQDTLQSGTNIKTINNTSLLGSGNIDIQGGGGGGGTLLVKYGETTYDALKEAYETGMSVMADDDTTFSKYTANIFYMPINPPEVDGYEVGFLSGDYPYYWQCVQTNGVVEWTEVKGNQFADIRTTGELTDLTTTDKSNLVGAINEVNAKGGGIDFEVGVEKWYGTYKNGDTTYQVYSKVIYIPALSSASGATDYPHGITGINQVLAVYGVCTNGMVMNAPRQSNQDNICVYQVQKGGNFVIEVGKDRSSIGAYVTIIYVKNN